MKEYFLFDCLNEYLDPPLQGYRLQGATYEPIAADETRALLSEELGLRLRAEEGKLQFYHLDSETRLLDAQERAEREVMARQAAEAEVARLRAELARRSG